MSHNIYIYGNIDFSANSAGAKRMMYYAMALADKNHKVYLISCSLNSISHENFVQVAPHIFQLQKLKISNTSRTAFKFIRRLYHFSRQNGKKAIFLIYPQSYFYLELFSVLYLKFMKKQNLYYELNEVKKYASIFHEPLSIFKLKYVVKTVIFKAKFVVMDGLMRYYDGLICISKNIEKYGQKYNRATLRIPILTDSEIVPQKTNTIYAEKTFFNIGFSGSIVPSKENLFEFVSVINALKDNGKKIRFNLCGSITEKNLKALINNMANHIVYYGNLGKNELSSFLIQQDLLIVPRGYTKQNNYGFSTKLSDYLNHKKMVLVTDISDNTQYIKDNINGFVVEPNNPEMMYNRISYIIENFEHLKDQIIENAHNTSKNEFDYRLYKQALHLFFKPSQLNTAKAEPLSNA